MSVVHTGLLHSQQYDNGHNDDGDDNGADFLGAVIFEWRHPAFRAGCTEGFTSHSHFISHDYSLYSDQIEK
jgi:hypothetical protein